MATPSRAAKRSSPEARIDRALRHCEDHLDDELSLETLAGVAGFSPFHFHRLFRSVTGETPKEYLRRLRLERSAYRLKNSRDNVIQIAVESGFAGNETFTRAFKQRFGMSPSAFRTVLEVHREFAKGVIRSETFAGFSEDTPFTLRFNLYAEPLTIEVTPPRHVLSLRYRGYNDLYAHGTPALSLWDDLIGYAESHHIAHNPEVLIGITNDDPYVTEDANTRFDACLLVQQPIQPDYPFTYRYLPSQLCASRRHAGGIEEVAKTFALIGLDWLNSNTYVPGRLAPFETHHTSASPGVRSDRAYTTAYVPIEASSHPLTTPSTKGTTN